MGQLYLQRFGYRGAVGKAEFDKTWSVDLETFARTGNFTNSYAHLARITFEPVFDMDAACASVVGEIKAKVKTNPELTEATNVPCDLRVPPAGQRRGGRRVAHAL